MIDRSYFRFWRTTCWVLLRLQPSPVVELNRAVAVAMSQGAEAGLRLLQELEKRGELRGYYLLPAAQADLARRLQQWTAAAGAYRRALALATNEAERKFLRSAWLKRSRNCTNACHDPLL